MHMVKDFIKRVLEPAMSSYSEHHERDLALAMRLFVRGGGVLGAALLLSYSPAMAAVDLTEYSDFGQSDILLTAATIRQSGDDHMALIDQTNDGGTGNIAQVDQDGATNAAYVTQIGDLNRARVAQYDSDNMVTINQEGIGNSIDVSQTGYGNVLNGLQRGDGNVANITQTGDSNITFFEIGNNNILNISNSAAGVPVQVYIQGDGVTVTQR